MNEDAFAGQWKEMRGTLKSWWGKLTGDDFEWIGGQKDKLIDLIQEKYGYTRDQARDEIERRFKEYRHKTGETMKPVADALEAAGSYLHERRLADVAGDVTALVRRYPIQTLVVGLGLGYLMIRRKKKPEKLGDNQRGRSPE